MLVLFSTHSEQLFQYECERFTRVSKHVKTDERFYCFQVLANPDETRCTIFWNCFLIAPRE